MRRAMRFVLLVVALVAAALVAPVGGAHTCYSSSGDAAENCGSCNDGFAHNHTYRNPYSDRDGVYCASDASERAAVPFVGVGSLVLVALVAALVVVRH